MPTELTDALTVLNKPDLAVAMYHAWDSFFGQYPKKESLWVVLAQIQLETGLKYCHNWNLGNCKSIEGDGHDYQYYGCGEELPIGVAQHAVASSPLVTIKRVYTTNGQQMASVWVAPKHPWCRFRAFEDLQHGAADHLVLLSKRFAKAWPAVVSGSPAIFAHLLRIQHYYTAPEEQYAATLTSCYNEWSKLPVNYDQLAPLTDDQKSKIQDLVALGLRSEVEAARLTQQYPNLLKRRILAHIKSQPERRHWQILSILGLSESTVRRWKDHDKKMFHT